MNQAIPNVDACIAALKQQKEKLQELMQLRIEVINLQRQIVPRFSGAADVAVIAEEVAREFEVDINELFGRKRVEPIVMPRQIVYYLARELTDLSLNCIGEIVGGRDHGTVFHGSGHIRDLITVDAKLREKVKKTKAACQVALTKNAESKQL